MDSLGASHVTSGRIVCDGVTWGVIEAGVITAETIVAREIRSEMLEVRNFED
jgi:hypothetical protein